jgi:hypothetical protein
MAGEAESYAEARAGFERLQVQLARLAHDLIESARALRTDPIRFRDSLAFLQMKTADQVEAMLAAYETAYDAMIAAWDALPPEERRHARPPLDGTLMRAAPTR